MITMDYIMNATEEIAASRNYTNIKMLKVLQETSPNPEDDLIGGTWPGWYTTADSGRLDLGWHKNKSFVYITQNLLLSCVISLLGEYAQPCAQRLWGN